jgi:hypothetical protein
MQRGLNSWIKGDKYKFKGAHRCREQVGVAFDIFKQAGNHSVDQTPAFINN